MPADVLRLATWNVNSIRARVDRVGPQHYPPKAVHRLAQGNEDVGGDLVLTADGAATDLATASMARLGGRAIAMAGLVVVGGVVLSRLLGWARTAVFAAARRGGNVP